MESDITTKCIDVAKTSQSVEKSFSESALPALVEVVKIPNQSKSFDPNYNNNGLLEKVANCLIEWGNRQKVKGLKLELVKDPDRSPLIFGEVASSEPNNGTILFYGHFDKQPPGTGWKEGLGPTTPVIQDGKLYGRGAADDCYSFFAAILAIQVCQEQRLPHGRCVLLFEGDEESGTGDVEHYFEKLKARIGNPDIMVILDSGCFNYEQLWITNSLRGLVGTTIKIEVMHEGVHSGDASGIVPETFRIGRILLNRLDHPETGEVDSILAVNIPADRYKQAQDVANTVGDGFFKKFTFMEGCEPVTRDPFRAYLNRIWKPQLSIVGADGLPPTEEAANVLRASTTLKISMRIPPTLDIEKAKNLINDILTKNPPYGAKVTIVKSGAWPGWNAPPNQPYLEQILERASKNFFGKPPLYIGEGGSIPFLNFLEKNYPKAQFLVTGVLGPNSNAHGPNESLDLPFTKKLICCISQVIADSFAHFKK